MLYKTMCQDAKALDTQEEKRNDVPIGRVSGYIATWDIDRGGSSGIRDQFVKGAFLDSIERHKAGNRQIRLKADHDQIIGGFPIDTVYEDDRGLFGVAEINLDVQKGREVYNLAKQGVITDFSIGWKPSAATRIKDSVRSITKAEIYEGSLVGEPMNPKANVVSVKDFSNDETETLELIAKTIKEILA